LHSFHALDESFSAVPNAVEIAVPAALSQMIPTEHERPVLPALNSAVAENLLLADTANFVKAVVDAVISPAEPERTAKDAAPLEYWDVLREIEQFATAPHPAVSVSNEAWLAERALVRPKIVTVTAPEFES
jgi:hypothetical protein